MATFIPRTGVTQEIPPPATTREIARLLGLERNQEPTRYEDYQGATWWFWRIGNDVRQKNQRACDLLRRRTHFISVLGDALYMSPEESETVRESFPVGATATPRTP